MPRDFFVWDPSSEAPSSSCSAINKKYFYREFYLSAYCLSRKLELNPVMVAGMHNFCNNQGHLHRFMAFILLLEWHRDKGDRFLERNILV